jgi:glucan biosynthesis protein C
MLSKGRIKMKTQSVIPQRRYDLDWLRVLAILAIFVFHNTRLFDTFGWIIKNPTTYTFVDVWNGFATIWGMPLILVISGASVYYNLGKVGAGQYLKGILARLLLPLIVGILTHAALQVYLEHLQAGKFSGSFFEFYPHYFDGLYGFGGNFAWMGLHLWYLEVLFILSLLFLPLFLWFRKTHTGQRALQRLGDFLARPGMAFLFALPVLLLINTLDPKTWGIRELGGWSLFIYPFFFLPGFVIVSNGSLQTRIRQTRWWSLGAGAVLAVGYLVLRFDAGLVFSLKTKLADTLLSVSCWCWLLAVFGFGFQYLNVNRPFLRYANEAVLPFYILHQTVIISLGYFMVQWVIRDGLKFSFILIASFLVSVGVYEFLVRRNNLLRILFGMKPKERRSADVRSVLAGQEA